MATHGWNHTVTAMAACSNGDNIDSNTAMVTAMTMMVMTTLVHRDRTIMTQ